MSAFSRNSGVDIEAADLLMESLASVPGSVADLLSVTGVRIAAEGDVEFGIELGRAAIEMAETTGEMQLAHVCLAQTYFRGRKDPEQLAAFEAECGEAIRLGHAGTFCYERLAVLYEHRGDFEGTIALCEKAAEVLGAAGDERSAATFRKKIERVQKKQATRTDRKPGLTKES